MEGTVLSLIILVVLNGIFAMSEMALVSAKRIKLQQLAENGSSGALKAISLQDEIDDFISTVQICITVIGIANGVVGEKFLTAPLASFLVSIGISSESSKALSGLLVISVLTLITVVFGEIVPKRVALVMPERVSSSLAIPMLFVSKILRPVSWIFGRFGDILLRAARIDESASASVSNEEIKDLMGQGEEAGVFHESERRIVSNVLHLDERRIDSMMTHRSDVFHIDLLEQAAENVKKLAECPYSKAVAVNGGIDDVVGIVRTNDAFKSFLNDGEVDFKAILEKIAYLPETVTAAQAMESFKREKTEIAVVVNEYGENVGIITVSDIMEAIVGDFPSEDEEAEIEAKEDGTYSIDGLLGIDKLASLLDVEEEDIPVSDGINTVSGLIMEHASSVPHAGLQIAIGVKDFLIKLEVIKTDRNCVKKASLAKIEPAPELAAEAA